MDRQEQMQRIVSYISFQRIPGEQPGIFCVSEAAGKNYPGRITRSAGETFCKDTASK